MLFKAVSQNNRALAIWWDLCPWLFLAAFLSAVVKTLNACAAIWLSARFLTELAGPQNPRTLIALALAQLLSSAVLTLLCALGDRLKDYEADCAACLYNKIYMEKMLSLDYPRAHSQGTCELYAQIMQNDTWSALGIREAFRLFELSVAGAAKILAGAVLTFPLFLSPIPQPKGILAILDHPACPFLLAAVMAAIALLSSACAQKAQDYWTRHAARTRFGNRLADFYITAGRDRKRALDMRIYDQQKVLRHLYVKDHNPFGPSSQIARQAKGPMGLWAALSQSASAVLTALVSLYVCLKAWAGAFGPGSVTLYIGSTAYLFQGISQLSGALGRMTANISFLETSFRFLDLPNTMYQGGLTTEKRRDGQYEIEFRDVSFRYPGAREYALSHVTMTFPIGSRLAVVGMNGSGKTTFIKLLCRLCDPTEGQILLNSIDIRKYRYDDYMDLFSVVFQDFKLFSFPLGENVSGSLPLDPHQADQCLKKAGFLTWDTALPQGLSTPLFSDLDDRGVELSGGEAQKIAIARALYKDAPFVILDEPTAALDPLAEAEVYEKFGQITEAKTAVCISHRLSSCRFCHKIIVFDGGSIVQVGTHEQLVHDKEGKYYELWHAQAQYYDCD